MSKKNIKNIPFETLVEEFAALGLEGYRARQVRQWIFQKDAATFFEMSNISKKFQALLDEHYSIDRLPVFIYAHKNALGDHVAGTWVRVEDPR